MPSIASWSGFILRLVGVAAFSWLLAASADHVWPAAKWYFVALFIGGWIFASVRQFVGGISEYREATKAFIARRITSSDLPTDFRSLGHDTTLQQVLDEFGPPTRTLELVAPAADDLPTRTKFFAYEYSLPYEAAVLIMPEPPGDPTSRIRAVYFQPRANEDDFLSPVRH